MANKTFTQEQKNEALAKVKELGGGQKATQQVAKEYGVHFTTIYGWAKNGKKPVKVSPKRKIAKKPVARKPTENDWEKAFDTYIEHRDAAAFHSKEAEKAKKVLERIVEQLR